MFHKGNINNNNILHLTKLSLYFTQNVISLSGRLPTFSSLAKNKLNELQLTY
jgi:hypothetical protein